MSQLPPKANNSASNDAESNFYFSKIPWIRMMLFLLLCFTFVFPFTKTGKDVVGLMKRKQFAEGRAKGERLTNQGDSDFKSVYELKIKNAENALKTEKSKANAKIASLQKDLKKVKASIPRKPVAPVDKDTDVRKTVRGFSLKYKADFQPGEKASQERLREDSYVADFILRIKEPKAAQTLDDLQESNDKLGAILPGLEKLIETAEVSPFYNELYANKKKRVRAEMLSLGKVLTMHNYYDCETMLEMIHPETKRKVFLFQADMDVVTDGSDGDRLSEMPDSVVNSTYYQPFTSYGWDKVTDKPNPMVAGWEQRVRNAQSEMAKSDTSRDRKNWLRSRLKMLHEGIDDMKKRSFLIAEHDPFIVVAVNQIISNRSNKFAPRVGDYVAVIHAGNIYPAIVGDGGPTFKAGEGSLRLAKTINPAATSYNRPVSDLAVTYLVFPGTAPNPKAAPDYELWQRECKRLLDEIGGIGEGYQLHQWKNTLPGAQIDEGEQLEDDSAEQPSTEDILNGGQPNKGQTRTTPIPDNSFGN